MTLSALLSGSGNLIKTGNGTLTLAELNNTYSGTTTVVAGALRIEDNSNLGRGAVTLDGGALEVTGTDMTVDNAFTLTSSLDLVANFALQQYTITVSADPVIGGTASGGGVVSHGDIVTLTVSAETGYHFVNWTVSGTPVSTDASYIFTATTDLDLVANFDLTPTATPTATPTQTHTPTPTATSTGHAHQYTNADRDGCGHRHGDAYIGPDSDVYGHRHGDAYTDSDADGDKYSHACDSTGCCQ